MKYIKKFTNMSEYQAFKGGWGDYITPNLCLLEDSYTVVLEPEAVEVKTIKFYVANSVFLDEYIEYTAIENMTWGEWLNSSYNVDGFYIDNRACLRSPNGIVKNSNGHLQNESDIIIENYYYVLEP